MKKKDLKSQMVVETKNGDLFVVCKRPFEYDALIGLKANWGFISLSLFNDDLTYINGNHIMKVYKDFTLKEILWEREKEFEFLGDLIDELMVDDSCEFVTIDSEEDCDTYDGLLDDISRYLDEETVEYRIVEYELNNNTAIITVRN